jgi:Entner-Doudoroff aldolase
MSLVLAGALISIALNPFLFAAIEPFRRWALQRSDLARRLERRKDPYAELPMSTERKYLEGQVVLVGYGRVGRRVAKALDARGIPYVVAEQNRELVEGLRKKGMVAVSGDATEPAVLIQAHIAEAAMLVGATPELLKAAAASPLPFAPGIATASELMQALAHGFDLVKFFPAEQSGGIKALRALAGPFPNVLVCPTGGIGEANAAAWLAEPNVLAVGGSWLCPAADIRSGNWAGISAMCARAMKSLKPA